MKTEFELHSKQDDDGDWHYWIEGGDPGWFSATDKIFVSDEPFRPDSVFQGECFYIEPCGQFPGGFYVPLKYLEDLLNEEVVYPYWYERDPQDQKAIEQEGIGFQILAESESEEADAIEARLTQIGGFVL